MQLFGLNPTKCKTNCKLGVGRIKLLRNKKQVAMRGLRKEVAELLRQDKQGNARIRVESVMREHNMLQAFEILELYLELLAVRAELLSKTKEIPPDMLEAICSLIYAGERVSTDLAEVAVISKMLVSKYSSVYSKSGFPAAVVSDHSCRAWQVNDNLVSCLAVAAPMPEDKLKFLEEIAAEYGVEFDKEKAAQEMLPASGKPFPMPDPLAPGGAGVPLAQGWAPGPAAASAAPQGWQPPSGGGTAAAGSSGAAQAAAAGHVSRVLSGGSVVVRKGGEGGQQPCVTVAPVDPSSTPAWSPPQPEDIDKHGRAFQSHVGAAAAWRQTRLHGTSPDTSQHNGEEAYPPPATAATPVPVPPGGAHLPHGTAQSSGTSTPTPGGTKPATPMGSYADASAAAEAAKRYSQMAQQAAQRAEEFATSHQARTGRDSGGTNGSSSAGPGSPGGAGNGSTGPSSPGGGGSPPGGIYVPRSPSEVQRAYDAAPGPPTKGEVRASGPPSAPPSMPPSMPPSVPPPVAPASASASGAGNGGGAADLDLPSVPSAGPPPARKPAASDDQNELDELTKRFEMLKRR